MREFAALFISEEVTLTHRTLELAKARGYDKYIPTLPEVWCLSISHLTETLILATEYYDMTGPEFSPDDTFTDGPIAQFAIREAEAHRKRGVSICMFLGLLKYYRRAYLEVIDHSAFSANEKKAGTHFLICFFDHLEIALAANWTQENQSKRYKELQDYNRIAVNEKNKYITVFEHINSPILLLDLEHRIEALNKAAATLLDIPESPNKLHQAHPLSQPGNILLEDVAPWLAEPVLKYSHAHRAPHTRLEVTAPFPLGSRHYNVTISHITDPSGDTQHTALILDDISYRVETTKMLKQEHDRTKHYLEIAGSIILILDTNSTITLINRAGCDCLGYEEAELLGENWFDIAVPEDQQAQVHSQFAELFAHSTDEKQTHISQVQRKNNERRIITWHNQVLYDDQGKASGILSSGTDITEQRRVEEALAEQELWLRSTFVSLGDAILILTPERHLLEANPAALNMFKIPQEMLRETALESLYTSPQQYETFIQTSQTAFDEDRPAHFEMPMRRTNGDIFEASHVVSMIHSDDGTELGIVNIIRDISIQKKAESALLKSEEKFRRIFESIGEGYVVTDLDGTVLMVNPATCKILGYKEHEMVGNDLSRFYLHQQERLDFRQKVIEQGSVSNYQITAVHRDGHSLITEVNGHLIKNEANVPVAMEGTFRDITLRIEAANLIREQEEQYRAFFENNHAIMLLVAPDTGSIVDANPAACTFYGYAHNHIVTMNISQISTISEPELFAEMKAARQEQRSYFLFKHRMANGSVRDVEVYSGPIMVQGRQLLYSVIHDVTARVVMEQRIKHMATTDALTGTNNRHQFFLRAKQEIARTIRHNHDLSVLMLDVDHFKAFNDTYGHQFGDKVLISITEQAHTTLRDSDVFGRLGGEEFAAILPETSLAEAEQAAERLRSDIAAFQLTYEDAPVHFTVSIGIATYDQEDGEIEATLHRADMALYRAKASGRNQVATC